jgi:hypothetical protein
MYQCQDTSNIHGSIANNVQTWFYPISNLPEREYRCGSTLSLTSTLDGCGSLTPLPSRFTPVKEPRYPLYRTMDGPQGHSGGVRKISPQSRFNPRTVQPVASSYTGYAIPAPCPHLQRNPLFLEYTDNEDSKFAERVSTNLHGVMWPKQDIFVSVAVSTSSVADVIAEHRNKTCSVDVTVATLLCLVQQYNYF